MLTHLVVINAATAAATVSTISAPPLHNLVSGALDRHAQRQQSVLRRYDLTTDQSLETAPAETWRAVIDVLAPFMKEKRVRRQVDSLNKRRANCHIVLENLSDPSYEYMDRKPKSSNT